MTKSSGVLLYRQSASGLEFLLVHPGGPFWSNKDAGAWSIPKGLVHEGEESLAAAVREFREETGSVLVGDATFLGSFRQPSEKSVDAWLKEGAVETSDLRSNTFDLEWPPKSGTMREFPEVDRWLWCSPEVARVKILKGQRAILESALEYLAKAN